jgi:hypothetical protein
MLDLGASEGAPELDPRQAIQRLQDWFPEAVVLPGDQLARAADQAEVFFADQLKSDRDGPESRVIASLRGKASRYGPALAFRIPVDASRWIDGSARRVDITFQYDDPLPERLGDQVVAFLKTFGVGRIERSVPGGTSTELVFDNALAE